MNRRTLILLIAAVSLVLYSLLAWFTPDSPQGCHVIVFLIVTQLLLLAYLGLRHFAKHNDMLARENQLFWILVLFALVIRISVVVGAGEKSHLSDDVYRYIFEGKMVTHAYNPYTTSPEDLAGSGLVDSTIYPNINHPRLPTIYPPLSQYLFAAAHLIGGDSLLGFKIISFLFEILTALAVFFLVRRLRLPRWTFLIYLFSTVVILEFLYSNHLDILAMPFFVLALLYIRENRPIATGLCLGLAAMVKLFAVFCLPVFLIYLTGWRRWKMLAAFIVVCAVLYAPFVATAGLGLFGSLWTYLGEWQFNGSVFGVLNAILPASTARIVCGVLFGLVAAAATLYRSRNMDPLWRAFVIFGAYIIFTPSLFPWYLVWVVPFLVIFRNVSFLILTGTVMLSYHVKIGYFETGEWSQYWQLLFLEYAPFYGWLAYEFLRTRIRTTRIAS